LVTSLTAAAMVFYFWRTTGSRFRTPYAVYVQAYDPVPIFPWYSVGTFPSYNHAKQTARAGISELNLRRRKSAHAT
jgi:hypothetical protein